MSPLSVPNFSQISAQSEHAFVFYGEFCEVCEMKMKKKTKKLKRNCDRILENLPFGHKLTFWENSNENFNNIF